MKNAAKCDTSCELQNLVSHQNFERNLRFLVKHVCWSVCFIPTEPILLYGSGAGCRCDALNKASHSHAQMKHHFFGRGNTAENMTWNIPTFFDDRRRNHSFRDVILYQILPENESPSIYKSSSFGIGPPIRQDYPLNLSILISGGKETNQDSPSNCE